MDGDVVAGAVLIETIGAAVQRQRDAFTRRTGPARREAAITRRLSVHQQRLRLVNIHAERYKQRRRPAFPVSANGEHAYRACYWPFHLRARWRQ